MPCYSAFTTLRDEASAHALGAALEGLEPLPTGVGVFEFEDGSGLWELAGYFDATPDQVALSLLAAVHGAAAFVVSELPDTDWVAKVRRDLSPVEAGRFFLYGAHDAERVPEGRIGLLIEASMAFGTGHHGTTLGCLRMVDRLADEGFAPEGVADIGCGTAVLAMAAARVWDTPVIASDLDAVAIEVALANLRANALEDLVDCVEAAGCDHQRIANKAPFGLIFANILMGPLIALAPDIARISRPEGRVILSGILNEQADDVAAVYFRNGFNLSRTERIGDWSTLLLAR